jgi:outer membrane protein
VCLLTCSAAFAAEPAEKLSYERYIQQLASILPELAGNEIELLTARNDVKSAQGAGNVSLSASGASNSSRVYSDPGGTSGNLAESSLSATLSKKFTSTGTTVAAGGSYFNDRYSSFPSSEKTSVYKPSATVKVTQPLLQNFLGKVDRFAEHDAKARLDIAAIQLSENNKSTLNAYRKIFFEWEAARRILKSSADSIENAQTLSNQVGRNYRAGLAEDYAYQQTMTSVLTYKGIHQQKQTSLATVERQLGVYIDSSKYLPDSAEFETHLRTALEEQYPAVLFTSTESAKVLSLTLNRYTDAAEVYKNGMLPSLDVYGSVTKKDRDNSASLTALPDTDYGVGFSLTYTFGNDTAGAKYEAAKIQQKQIALEIRTTENSFKKSLLGFQETAAGTKALIKNKEETISALTVQLASQRKKYSQGRLGISDVITTENSIDSAKIELINLQYTMISTYIDYKDLVK